MSEYSLQQLKAINEYRVKNNLGFVLSDEAVASIMQKEMKKTGKIYPGFESLSASNKKMLENSPVFSIGLNLDKQKGISIEKTPKSSEKILPTEVQTSAIDFLKTVTGQANDTVTERDKEAGVLSSTVNLWQETFNKDLAKSTVKNEIKSTQEDIKLLERASRGEAVYDNLFTGETVSTSFEEMFKKRRGVEFNEQAINDCKEKSQQFARVKTVVNMISDIKDEFKAIADNPMSQFNPEQSSAAIVKAFKMSGVTKLEDMNAVLKDIETKNKDNPYISKFGQNLRFETNSNGEPVLMRTTSKGEDVPATAPFKVIAQEVGMRLDKSLATALGIKYNENATAEDMSRLTQQSLEKYQKEYETSFSKAFGKKDLKILADNYVTAQQQGVANIEAGLDIASMALMLVPGGAAATSGWLLKGSVALKNSATVGKAVKTLGMVDKSKKAVKAAQTMQKVQQAASPFVMANLTLRPTELLEQLTSENGMNSQEWEAWGKEVLENSVYMTVGAGVSKLAEQGAAMYKTKALVSTLKKAGKSADEISAMVKANPVKFPKDIVQSFKKIDNLAKALQVSSETALDISSTYFVNQLMDNGDVTKQDWLMSVGFALSGGVLQKQFKHLNTETKVKYIQDAFKEYGVTKDDAANILKTMDDISAGKLRITSESKKSSNTKSEIETSSENETKKTVKQNPIEAIKRKKKIEILKSKAKELQPEIQKELNIARKNITETNNKNLINFFENLTKDETLQPEDIEILGNLAFIKDEKILNEIISKNSGKQVIDVDFNEIQMLTDIDLEINSSAAKIAQGESKSEIHDAVKASKEINKNIDTKSYEFNQDVKFESLKKYIDFHANNGTLNETQAKYLYEKYYLADKSPEIQTMAKAIADKFGVYTFVRSKNDGSSLEMLSKELNDIEQASGKTASYPACIDFTKYNKYFVRDEASGISSGKTINVLGNKQVTLRHELIHQNDPYNSQTGDLCNYEKLDEVLSGKYMEEFRKAGIDERSIQYAHTNRADYIAVLAAQGDLSKCSKEFKDVLINNLGMPEWAFKLKPLKIATELSSTVKDLNAGDVVVKEFNDYGRIEITKYDENKYDYKLLDNKSKLQLSSNSEQQVRNTAKQIHDKAVNIESSIVSTMHKLGLGNESTMTHRAKSEQSIYDKIKNAMLDPKYPASFEDAVDSVRDMVGTRTRMEDFDYKQYPELVELYKTDPQKAIRLAAEMQSEQYVKSVENIILQQANGTSPINAIKISNYMGKDGISYFSDKQVAYLRDLAAKHDIDLDVGSKTTKVRASGYTALQMNFTTKDGATYEWQLRGSKVNEFAECEHVPYDIRENKDVTGGREILKELYSPIENIVKGLSADDFDEYNNYLTAHYEHLRKLELGFESSAPILPLKFDKRLSAENLENLHKVSDELKNGKISQEEALNMYDKLVNKSSTSEKGDVVYEFLHSDKLSSLSDEDRKFYLKNTKLDKYGQVNPNADYDTEVLNKIFRFAEVNPKIDIEDVENIIRGYNTAEIALNEGRKSFDKVMEVYKDSDYEKILNRKPSFAEAEALSLADTPAKAEYLKSKLKVMAENSDKLGNDFYALTRRLERVETDSQIKLIDTVIDKKIKYPYLEQRLFENVKDDYSVETALKIFSKTDDINTAINLASKNKSQAFDKMLNKLLDSGMTVDDIYLNLDKLNNDIQYKFVAENYKPKLGNLLFNLAGYNNLTNDAQADFLTKILKSKDNLDTDTALDLTIYVQYIKSQKQTDFVLNWINKLPDMNLNEINENFHLFSLSDIDIDKIAERKLMEYPDFSYENSRGIVELAQMSDEDFKTVSDRNLVKARLYGTYIDGLIGMSDEQWANVEKRNLTRNKNRVLGNISGQNLTDTDIMQLAGLSDAEYDRINDLIYIEARKSKQLSGSVLVDIARYPDDKFDFAKELVLMKNDLDAVRFRSYDIRMLTNLEGEELKRAKEIIAKNGLLRSSEVIELINMPESDWNNLHVRFGNNIEDLQNSQDVEDIKLLSSLTDDEFERFDKTIFQDKELASQISDYSFPMETVVKISKLDDKAIANIKKRNILKLSNNENIISLLAKSNDAAFSYFAKAIENPQEAGNINVLAEIADKPDMISKEALDKRIGCLNMLMQFDEDLKNNLIKSNININDIQSKLAYSLGERRPNVDTPKVQQLKFVTEILANNNSNTEKVLKEYDFTQFGKEGIPLKYSRDDFNKAINEIIESVPESERNLLLNHFGLEKGEAGYDGLLNNKPFENQNVSKKSKIAAEKILQEINKFTLNNEVMLDDKFAKAVLDGLVKGLPEFTSIIGKKQHGTHAYSVDIHTMKVLQTAMNDPLYNTLSDVDKTIVKFAALLHDTGKRGGIIDKGHAALSADYALSVLDKFEFPDRVKHRIIDIIDNHHWFEAYNTGKATAQDVAVRCRRPEDFKIYEILAKADFASVNDDFHLSLSKTSNAAEFDTFMDNKFKAVEDEMKNLYSKANIVLDTQFVQNGKLFPTQSVKIGNKETQLKVLNLSQLDNEEDLSKYGFAPGVTRDNARFTVHMTDPEFSRMESVYVLLNNPLNQSGWSTSLISASNNRTYVGRKFGFIFDTDQANISKAYYENLGSGTQKDIGDFKELLFSDGKKRSYVKDNLIADLKEKGIEISDDEYAQLTKYLLSKKYTNQIKDIRINNKVIKAEDLVSSLDKSRDELFNGSFHSEIVSLNPRIKGLVAKVEKLENCPKEFLEFAQKYNLPIILMKPSGDL